MNKRHLLVAAAALATLGALPLHTLAQDKPPSKIVVGFPPGGSADLLARLMAEGLKNDFSSVIVENKPGAGGRIALSHVKRAPADGQTVVIPRTDASIEEDPGTGLAMVEDSVSLPEVVAGLNALGVSARDMIDILKSIKAAGALHAEFIVQ